MQVLVSNSPLRLICIALCLTLAGLTLAGLSSLQAQIPPPAGPASTPADASSESVEAHDGAGLRPTASLLLDGRQHRLPVTLSEVGPLFALEPLLAWLGGELEPGAYDEGFTLTLRGTALSFGPESQAITRGEIILPLSQTPLEHVNGLMVPLDFLRLTFGGHLGYRFDWDATAWQLRIEAYEPQEVQIDATLLHLSGVSTLSLRFRSQGRPTAVRYRLQDVAEGLSLLLLDDRIAAGNRPPHTDPLIDGVLFSSSTVTIVAPADVLATRRPADSGTAEQLVFEFERGRAPQPALSETQPQLVPPPSRSVGIGRIVIDPGHGGSESGAIGPSGAMEKDLALQLARQLASQLSRRMNVKVLLTRDGDENLSREARTAFANFQKADLFISLHLNSSYGRGAQGAETYILSQEASDERAAAAAATENSSPNAAGSGDPLEDLQLILWDMAQSYHLGESQRLANFIQQELNDAMGLRDRGVKQAPFRVLMGAAMPAVLVELGFISNPQEEARLQDPAYQAQLAAALTRAIMRYRAQAQSGAGAP